MTLLAAPLNFNSKVNSFNIWPDTKSKGSNLEDTIWSDGPNSEFKVCEDHVVVYLQML